MIAVNLKRSYKLVLTGQMSMEAATLGWWQGVTDDAIERYGDVVIGVYGDVVVSVFDVTGHERNAEGRVAFDGVESETFGYLLNQKSPVKPWVRGQARPVQYIDTDVVRTGEAPVEDLEGGYRRAVVGGYVLTVDADGIAIVEPPEGGVVTVLAAGASGRLLPAQLTR
jgi:hypothetical protein